MAIGTLCCAVLDCRRTGKPYFDRKVFICTVHIGRACQDRDLNEYTECAAARRRAEAQAARNGGRGLGRAVFLEANSWSRLAGQVAEKYPLKPGVELS